MHVTKKLNFCKIFQQNNGDTAKKERKWLYVDYEKINRVLMEILERKFEAKIEKKVMIKEENKWKEK